MSRRTRKTFELHSKTKDYKKRIQEAEDNVKTILKSKYTPMLEYSGGKDSIVLLSLVMQQDDTIPVFNHHPGYAKYLQQTYRTHKVHDEIMDIAKSVGCKHMIAVNTPFWNGEEYRIGEYFPMLFDEMVKNNCNLELLGIRGSESIGRKHRVQTELIHYEDYVISNPYLGGKYKRRLAFPLRNLTVDDIWAYILTNDIKYPSLYDDLGPIYGWDKVRFISMYSHDNIFTGGSAYFDNIFFSEDLNEYVTPEDKWNTGWNYLK